jgi:hypothetical protein
MSTTIEIDLTRDPLFEQATEAEDRFTLLRKVFGDGTALGWAEVGHPAIVADCQPGFSAETDYFSSIPESGAKIFGVWCGLAGEARLSAILCRKQAAFERFLTANPQLKGSVISLTYPGALAVWVRVTGRIIPPYVNFGGLSWCSQGMVPVGMPETPLNHVFLQRGSIPTVAFDDLKWTEQERQLLEMELLAVELGPAVRQIGKRRVLNPFFWARYLQRNLGIVGFDTRLRTFQVVEAGSKQPARLPEGEMIELIAKGLQGVYAADPGLFPPEEIRPSRIREILGLLKTLVWKPEVKDGEIVDRYLQNALEEHLGSQSASHELWIGLCAFCRARGLPLVPEEVFYRLVKPKIRAYFGKCSRHDLVEGHARGYADLRLKAEFAAAIADAPAQPHLPSAEPTPPEQSSGAHTQGGVT